ncbi:winged helix-turn-helix domain-containing protein [Nocardia sp. NBC_01009]|uniref:helix-turn-helix domain-containing protein n=1 Tax=Nocardia sp. NBC_01009 TaxID=2975996 RepID=UPI003862D6DE
MRSHSTVSGCGAFSGCSSARSAPGNVTVRRAPAYPSDLADQIGVSRQILSNHLACLRGCGLVVAVPEGRRSRYELADARIGRALEDLTGLVLAVDPACCPDSATEECC